MLVLTLFLLTPLFQILVDPPPNLWKSDGQMETSQLSWKAISHAKNPLSPTFQNNLTPTPVSLPTLLNHAKDFHQKMIVIHGIIKQPELHLDDTHLRLHFVFRLTEEESFITVFGVHDRTKGPPAISMDLQVEVVGRFFHERELNSFKVTNTMEAISVTPYPSNDPDRV